LPSTSLRKQYGPAELKISPRFGRCERATICVVPLTFKSEQRFIKEMFMNYRIFALILTLTVISWAQTASQRAPSTSEQPNKANCACCDKMAKSDSKDGHTACMRKHDGKEMASCCAGREAKSCSGKDAACCTKDSKMSESCCEKKDGMKCDRKAGKDCGKDCCNSKTEKTA
jgi:hypothetical protein